MGEAIRDAYGDLFLITAEPKDADREAIEGKFKSFHNASDNVASLMAKTFYCLLGLADLKENKAKTNQADVEQDKPNGGGESRSNNGFSGPASLNYNI